MNTINLNELERKAFRSFFGDGLWDIYLGLLLLALGIPQLLFPDWSESKAQRMGLYLVLAMLSWLAMWAGKKYITLPRMGQVKVGPTGKARRRKTRIVMIIAVLLNVAALVITLLIKANKLKVSWLRGLDGLIVPIGVALFIMIIFGLAAHFLAYNRLYIIGVLFALPWPVAEVLYGAASVDIGALAFLVPAGIVLLMGLVTFVRFLRENPLPAEPDPTTDR